MQNHLLQVMALVAMEQPLSFSAEHIRAEKLKVLHACDPIKLNNLVTGQARHFLSLSLNVAPPLLPHVHN